VLVPAGAHDRIACESLIGLSVGDALGARFEGAPFDPARPETAIEPVGIALSTDDTQMALSVVECLITNGRIDQDWLAEAFGRRYEPWRGYGRGMHLVLPELRAGKDWRELKESVFPGGSFGNGSAMRVAPLGAFFYDAPVETVVLEAMRSAEVTHAHPEGLTGAAATAVAAWLAARTRGAPIPPLAELYSAARAPLDPSLNVTRGIEAAKQLGPSVGLAEAVSQLGNGSMVSCQDTVPLALWIAFQHLDDFRTAVSHAVAAGGDTDTLAAIVGGIVASRVGVDSIPGEWRKAVEPLPVAGSGVKS
jgi:ADP-ribosylglycohydrolase